MEASSNKSENCKEARIWTRPFLKIMNITFFCTLSNSMLTQAIPLYVIFLGSSNAVAGVLTGVFTITSLLFRPLFGNMVDVKGRKTILMTGLGLYLITSMSYSLIPAVLVVLLLRGIQGVGNSAFSTTAGTVVADILPRNRISEGIGYYGVSFDIATAFGPALMLFLRDGFGYSSVFYSCAAIVLVAFGIGWTMNYEKKKTSNKPRISLNNEIKGPNKFKLKTAFEVSAIPASFVLLLIACPLGLTYTFLVRFSESLGITGIGLYFTINALSMLVTRLFIGRLCDKFGADRILPPGLLMDFLGILVIALARSLHMFLLAALFMGIGWGMVGPTIQALVMRNAPFNRRGAASATYYAAVDIGVGGGSMLGGILTQTIGYAATWAFNLVFIIGAMVMFLLVIRKKLVKEREYRSNILDHFNAEERGGTRQNVRLRCHPYSKRSSDLKKSTRSSIHDDYL